MPLVFALPDGTLQIHRLATAVVERERRPSESTESVVLRLAPMIQARVPELAGATVVLVREAELPPSRARRHAWRLQGGAVVVDPTVPDPPRRPTVAEVDAAATLPQLRDLVRWLVGGG